MKNYLKIVQINQDSMVPVYRQLVDAILCGVESGLIVKGDPLPSLHDFCVALEISRQSVEKAYNRLKVLGVVGSFQGKGYFILAENAGVELPAFEKRRE